MTPDIEQHIALTLGTLLAIGETLRRLLKRKKRVSLLLTIDDIPENSNDLNLNSRKRMADGSKTDGNDAEPQQEKQQKRSD